MPQQKKEEEVTPLMILRDGLRHYAADIKAVVLRAKERLEQGESSHELGEMSSSAEEHELSLAIAGLNYQHAREIETNLNLALAGKYELGTCIDCKEPIAAARLKAVPFTRRCRDCQERFEEEEKAAATSVREQELKHEDPERERDTRRGSGKIIVRHNRTIIVKP